MSISLATKGIIAGFGGGGSGSSYPDSYIATAIDIGIDLGQEIIIDIDNSNLIQVTVEFDEE